MKTCFWGKDIAAQWNLTLQLSTRRQSPRIRSQKRTGTEWSHSRKRVPWKWPRHPFRLTTLFTNKRVIDAGILNIVARHRFVENNTVPFAFRGQPRKDSPNGWARCLIYCSRVPILVALMTRLKHWLYACGTIRVRRKKILQLVSAP